MTSFIEPHGGWLVNRLALPEGVGQLEERARTLLTLRLGRRALSYLELVGAGALSPLEGFMTRDQYEAVVRDMRLPDGTHWSMPVTLAVAADEAGALREGEEVAHVLREAMAAPDHSRQKANQ